MSQLPWLESFSTEFPDTRNALDDPNGLLAAGDTLSTDQLLAAYQKGIFPWFEDGQPVLWWSPSPRLVLRPEQLHISKSMRKVLRRGLYTVTTNKCFDAVIRACAAPRDEQDGTWITEEIVESYNQLHTLGFAHSVEVWQHQELVGGLYGIALGKVFFGESMFSLASNASKFGFITLIENLRALNYQLIDCQVHSDHLASLGAKEISRAEFENYLLNSIEETPSRPSWPEQLKPYS
ncbi:MAG: leucyl/phenylalanyl-tRNA--protein transferase [Cellvibrionaceae bacterium]